MLPPKRVFIMRGLPGAGKTTMAQQLAAEAEGVGLTTAIHSTDSYFTDPRTGVYRRSAGPKAFEHDRHNCCRTSSPDNTVQDSTGALSPFYHNHFILLAQ
jgi:hypothetical protein